jgi:hypothetical protein
LERYRVITKSLIAGDKIYHYGDIITDREAGLNLSLHCGHNLIEPLEEPEPVIQKARPSLLRNLREIFS